MIKHHLTLEGRNFDVEIRRDNEIYIAIVCQIWVKKNNLKTDDLYKEKIAFIFTSKIIFKLHKLNQIL